MKTKLIKTLLLLSMSICYAKTDITAYSHDFWLPYYHKQRLSYCLQDQQTCGFAVANLYCQRLGYKKAEQATIDHNVGQTNYLNQKTGCMGWRCDGFKLIRCTANSSHEPKKNYYYRYKKFVFPRLHHYRIDWCYQNGKGCGQSAAHAFCRHMGYQRTTQFQVEDHLAATRAMGNQALCFKDCKGFAEIICYR